MKPRARDTEVDAVADRLARSLPSRDGERVRRATRDALGLLGSIDDDGARRVTAAMLARIELRASARRAG